MAHVDLQREMDLEAPTVIEGLPGVGLVGKIAADHLVRTLDMEYYAACRCEGLPKAAVYNTDERSVRPPVRLLADAERDLVVLQSDVPISPEAAPGFAGCMTGWFAEKDALPLYLSGLPVEKDDPPSMYGVGIGAGEKQLESLGIDTPTHGGIVRGPTGALLAEADDHGLDAIGLVVQSNAKFPDPESARILLLKAIQQIAEIDIDTDELVEQAEEIATARENLAQQMQEATDESSQASPLGMYQ